MLDASEDTGIGAHLPTRSWVFDVLVAAGFAGIGSAFLPVFYSGATTPDFVFVSLINLPLLLRRRLPKIAFGIVLAAGLAQILYPSPIGIHDAGLLFALYSVAGFTNRRVAAVSLTAMLALTLAGSLTNWWGFVDDQLVHGHGGIVIHVLTTLGMIILTSAAWASGERLRSARIGLVALAERAATLEREREQQSRLAAAAERSRIAREMHDVIAHALSVMIAQADGAGYVIDESPGTAKQALERISRTGRDSLTQMRGLLGLLREEEIGGRGVTPQPGLDQLAELIEEARDAGLQVVMHESGARRPLAPMVGLTLYRIVQEALSNARKHGGSDVEVGLEFGPDGIELAVHNGPAEPGRDLPGGPPGYGLTGMSERLSAIGGSLRAGPSPITSSITSSATSPTMASPGSSFAVVAWMPYTARM